MYNEQTKPTHIQYCTRGLKREDSSIIKRSNTTVCVYMYSCSESLFQMAYRDTHTHTHTPHTHPHTPHTHTYSEVLDIFNIVETQIQFLQIGQKFLHGTIQCNIWQNK